MEEMQGLLDRMMERGCRVIYFEIGRAGDIAKVATLVNQMDAPLVRLIAEGEEPDRETVYRHLEEMLRERAALMVGVSNLHAPMTRLI